MVASVIADVLKGASLSRALPKRVANIEGADKPKVQALTYGVLRHYERLNFFASKLLSKPPRARDDVVRVLLLIWLFELADGRTPPPAVVNGLVKTVKSQRKWAAGLINACLRRFQRETSALEKLAEDDLQASTGLPKWLATVLREAWPEHFEVTVNALASPPPMTLRVNLSQGSRDAYQKRLGELGLESEVHPQVNSALTLKVPVDVADLPGFETGAASVQDAAAQLAAPLLAVEPSMRILDACAAPGGKTAHILERVGGDIALTALEFDQERSKSISQTLERIGYQAVIKVADAGNLEQWWDGQTFHRVLLDAPCSATGTLRRNPDIKRHRKPADILALVKQQRRLLESLWETVRPGGMLVYATCSVIPDENESQIASFVMNRSDVRVTPPEGEWGHALRYGRQILPGEQGMDGFYYACLTKL